MQIPDLTMTYYRKILLVLIKHGVTAHCKDKLGLFVFFLNYLLRQDVSISNFLEGALSMPEKLKSPEATA